jgi:4Fe-4S ferredoxin
LPKVGLDRCDFCGGCSAVCPRNAITVFFEYLEIDQELCNECLVCKKICPVQAILKIPKNHVGVK